MFDDAIAQRGGDVIDGGVAWEFLRAAEGFFAPPLAKARTTPAITVATRLEPI
jgi:hypothetical protein